MVIFHNMHSCPSKHGIHKISSLSGTYGNNLHVRLTLDFLVIFPYTRYSIGNRDGCQAAATHESLITNTRYSIGNRDRGQAGAKSESTLPYSRHAIGNCYGGHAAATIESTLPYARHAVGNSDGG